MDNDCPGLRWPCCLTCTPICCAGCRDPATVVRDRGKIVGAFCRACFNELAYGEVPDGRTRLPRRPRGPSLRDIQDSA